MNKLNIALFAGGNSSEREVSIGSAEQVAEALDRDKYNVFPIDVEGLRWTYTQNGRPVAPLDRNDFSVTVREAKYIMDYALIMIHGTPGEDGMLQGYLDMMGVPYSSCGLASTVVTFDKELCKRTVAGAGVTVAREIMLRKGEAVNPGEMVSQLGLPMFIKPNASGSSCGVSKVKTAEEIIPAVELAFSESDTVMAEEFVAGREIACGLLVTSDRELVFPVTEIITGNEFFDYQAKYTPGYSDEVTPADIDPETAGEIQRLSLRAYKACNCRGLIRVDFIVREDGRPVMIEINSVPGMSAGSIIPKQAAAIGMSLGELFDLVIEDTRKKDDRN